MWRMDSTGNWRLPVAVSQTQLCGTARARGEEAVDDLQHRTRVKPLEAGLVEASVLGNATPDPYPEERFFASRT